MLDSLIGRLLVAHPDVEDPNFRRTVTLIGAHGIDGAFGLVLNRSLPVPVSEVLPAWAGLTSEPEALFSGGPVEPNTAFGLCLDRSGRLGEPIIGALRLLDLDDVPPSTEMPSHVRVFTGYAGWGAGQIEAEILAGGWRIVDATARDPFTDTPHQLWDEAYARPSSAVATVQLIPDEPNPN